MKAHQYTDLLRSASASPHGLILLVADTWSAQRVRRRLYAARDRDRKTGNTEFDQLSVKIMPGPEVWIIKREMMPDLPIDDGLELLGSEQLPEVQLPQRIVPHGPNRPSRPNPIHSLDAAAYLQLLKADIEEG